MLLPSPARFHSRPLVLLPLLLPAWPWPPGTAVAAATATSSASDEDDELPRSALSIALMAPLCTTWASSRAEVAAAVAVACDIMSSTLPQP